MDALFELIPPPISLTPGPPYFAFRPDWKSQLVTLVRNRCALPHRQSTKNQAEDLNSSPGYNHCVRNLNLLDSEKMPLFSYYLNMCEYLSFTVLILGIYLIAIICQLSMKDQATETMRRFHTGMECLWGP